MIVKLPGLNGWLNLQTVVAAYSRGGNERSIDLVTVDGQERAFHEENADAIRDGLDKLAAAFGGAFVVGDLEPERGAYVPPELPADETGEVKG